MEGFIIFLVITLIGFVVNKAKGNTEEAENKRKQMPPMGQGPFNKKNPPTPQRAGLGDYMKKVAQEVEKQMGETPKKEVQKKVENKVEEYKRAKEEVKPLLENARSTREEHIRSARPTMEQARAVQDEKRRILQEKRREFANRNKLVPRTKRGMAQAIIMSEILAPPLSKRKK
ncbi:MAG: hypothetical protein KBT36_11630 [Kurthia sp.]|nr:hypothetical protein [Candidatus Kurthia equi]